MQPSKADLVHHFSGSVHHHHLLLLQKSGFHRPHIQQNHPGDSKGFTNMGSGNSSPIKRAHSVETEAHQDLFELRFDHLAVGGTTILLIGILIAIWWMCKRRSDKRKARQQASARNRRRTRETPTPSPCRSRRDYYPYLPPPMPYPWPQPWPPQPPPTWPPWMMGQRYHGSDDYVNDNDRFIELPTRIAPNPPKMHSEGRTHRPPPSRPPLPSPAISKRTNDDN